MDRIRIAVAALVDFAVAVAALADFSVAGALADFSVAGATLADFAVAVLDPYPWRPASLVGVVVGVTLLAFGDAR